MRTLYKFSISIVLFNKQEKKKKGDLNHLFVFFICLVLTLHLFALLFEYPAGMNHIEVADWHIAAMTLFQLALRHDAYLFYDRQFIQVQ